MKLVTYETTAENLKFMKQAAERYDSLVAACRAAARCSESIKRNRRAIVDLIGKSDPSATIATESTFGGWLRNLEHAVDAIKEIDQ